MQVCLVLLGLAAPLVAARPARPDPIHLTDALGRRVVLPAAPRRIVTIFSSNTELVAALGLTDRIVGIDALTRYPPEAAEKPVVGGRLGISVDAVVGQEPDLVLLTRRARRPISCSPRWSGSACRPSS